MNKTLGILGLLIFICLLTAVMNPNFVTAYNMQKLLSWTSLFGILAIAVAFVIITGGIDLSIGSLVGLIGCLLPMALHAMAPRPPAQALQITLIGAGILLWLSAAGWLHRHAFASSVREGFLALLVPFYAIHYVGRHFADCRKAVACYLGGVALAVAGWLLPDLPLPAAASVVLPVIWMIAIASVIGLMHGLLVTQVHLQPFLVTLCGLLIYRGLARRLTVDQTQGFGTGYQGLKQLVKGQPCTMAELLLVAGGLVFLVAAGWLFVQRKRGQQDRGKSSRTTAWCAAVLGAVFVGCCGLQQFQDLDALPRDAASWCQQALFWCGVAGLVSGVLQIDWQTLRGGRWRSLLSHLPVLIGLGVLAAVQRQVPADAYGGAVAWWAVLLAALSLALVLVGIVWFLREHWREEPAWRWLTVLTAASGLLLLIGCTPLDRVPVPMPFLIMLGLALLSAGLLNWTIFGRYLLALGNNEEAARYSGVNTNRMVVAAYVLCAAMTGVAAILFALDINSVQPASHGNIFELYAIAAAVLGGCSLRGGEGSILGVVLGTAVIRVLYNATTFLGFRTQLEYTIIGAVILAGVIADEFLRRWAQQRRGSSAVTEQEA
jgi:ribose/xylose/arabinose/galactoside ABC-type transport system permease subunit